MSFLNKETVNAIRVFHEGAKDKITNTKIAKLLQTSPEALEEFEKAYEKARLEQPSNDMMQTSSQDAKAKRKKMQAKDVETCPAETIQKIIDELIEQTEMWTYNGKTVLRKGVTVPESKTEALSVLENGQKVSKEELMALSENIRPMCTGFLYSKDIPGNSYEAVLDLYLRMRKTKDPQKKQDIYNHFRQGLDILDLDPVLYEMLGMNPNAMGYWLPNVLDAVLENGFFKVPKTNIIKVPLPVLQLSRKDYGSINKTTFRILDEYIYRLCNLDETKEYFVKTGTFSSKYNFRNAKVTGAQEVRELAEYLLFLSNQAVEMAGPLSSPCIYGASTTNEWVVRKYIADKEENPCIYTGMPLHTEYRVFVDFDTHKVLGINPYWDPDLMKNRFENGRDKDTPTMKHDAIIFRMHEKTLMKRYEDNKDLVIAEIQKVINTPNGLTGQWSIDIMQNGNDFWLIDMALAEQSAMYEKTVALEDRRPSKENWIPNLQKRFS